MLQDSLRVSQGWRSSSFKEPRFNSGLNSGPSDAKLLMDGGFTRVLQCEEPPSLAELLRPNSTTSFLL